MRARARNEGNFSYNLISPRRRRRRRGCRRGKGGGAVGVPLAPKTRARVVGVASRLLHRSRPRAVGRLCGEWVAAAAWCPAVGAEPDTVRGRRVSGPAVGSVDERGGGGGGGGFGGRRRGVGSGTRWVGRKEVSTLRSGHPCRRRRRRRVLARLSLPSGGVPRSRRAPPNRPTTRDKR